MDTFKVQKALTKFKKKNTDEPPRCSAVIVAAGSSSRMGYDKIMGALGGIPVLVRTLRAFEESDYVDEIVLVTRLEMLEHAAMLCDKYSISKISKVICGGKTRTESALAGVSEVRKGAKLIAIHDGARPLVSQQLIKRVVYAARDNYSAVPAIKCTDTLKAVDGDGNVRGSVNRDSFVRIQTPQVFEASLIKGALTRAVKDGITLTDDCSAMDIMGIKTVTMAGEESNIKLTTPIDMAFAEAILRGKS